VASVSLGLRNCLVVRALVLALALVRLRKIPILGPTSMSRSPFRMGPTVATLRESN
jgi:hypothetical protein